MSPATAAEAAAVLANVPITYNSDQQTIDVVPRLRLAATHGPAELVSNYQYLDADWSHAGERNVLTANADWHHDSTLYNQIEQGFINGRAVYRQEDIGSLSWLRHATERDDLQMAVSWDRQRYAIAAASALTSYSYAQASSQYTHVVNERWQLSGTLGMGDYTLLNSNYRSQQWFGQLAAKRLLSERWSLTLQGGYSYLRDHQRVSELYCAESVLYCYLGLYSWSTEEVRIGSSGGAPSGSVMLQYQFARAALNLAASRAIQPSGFGALVTQDDASIQGTFKLSERWSVSTTVHGARVSDSLHHQPIGARDYYDADLAATWQWTEHWNVQLQGGYLLNVYDTGSRANATVSLSLSRQFGRIRLD